MSLLHNSNSIEKCQRFGTPLLFLVNKSLQIAHYRFAELT